jgi:hypothetical protein
VSLDKVKDRHGRAAQEIANLFAGRVQQAVLWGSLSRAASI